MIPLLLVFVVMLLLAGMRSAAESDLTIMPATQGKGRWVDQYDYG
jgi:hypothetical protein